MQQEEAEPVSLGLGLSRQVLVRGPRAGESGVEKPARTNILTPPSGRTAARLTALHRDPSGRGPSRRRAQARAAGGFGRPPRILTSP